MKPASRLAPSPDAPCGRPRRPRVGVQPVNGPIIGGQHRRMGVDQFGIQQHFDQDVPHEIRAKAGVLAEMVANLAGEIERQFGERPGAVKPVVAVVAVADDAPGHRPDQRTIGGEVPSRACRLRTRVLRSTTLSQSGTAVPARKYGLSTNSRP